MSLHSFVAWRYFKARRGFVSVVSTFSLIGITLGVAALIIVMSVMNGFREELMGKILGMSGHATAHVSYAG
ncbi:MAG: lipoprotein-releasing system transmembrane subunit LolC, partial [Pseudomonadota bacterium]|nr:lipoprotein-releasing system transmembrane subunit LolC [Pseudomonadota bacterium]